MTDTQQPSTDNPSPTRSINPWAHYQMGPNLRRFLGMDDEEYQGANHPRPSDEEHANFANFLQSYVLNQSVPSTQALLDLMEELTAMDLGQIALKLADTNQSLIPKHDVQALIAIGNAAIFSGDLGRAEMAFRDAQDLAPEEVTPYVNLAQILFSDGRDDEALEWCLAGFEAELNHRKLWQLLSLIYQQRFQHGAGEQIKILAERRNSWAGLSLAAEILEPTMPQYKAELLDKVFYSGERSIDFLIEYTGALGAAGEFAKIPPIVWQARNLASGKIDWQLGVHSFQAHLAMHQFDQAKSELDQLAKDKNITKETLEALSNALSEEITHAKESHSNH